MNTKKDKTKGAKTLADSLELLTMLLKTLPLEELALLQEIIRSCRMQGGDPAAPVLCMENNLLSAIGLKEGEETVLSSRMLALAAGHKLVSNEENYLTVSLLSPSAPSRKIAKGKESGFLIYSLFETVSYDKGMYRVLFSVFFGNLLEKAWERRETLQENHFLVRRAQALISRMDPFRFRIVSSIFVAILREPSKTEKPLPALLQEEKLTALMQKEDAALQLGDLTRPVSVPAEPESIEFQPFERALRVSQTGQVALIPGEREWNDFYRQILHPSVLASWKARLEKEKPDAGGNE